MPIRITVHSCMHWSVQEEKDMRVFSSFDYLFHSQLLFNPSFLSDCRFSVYLFLHREP